MAELKMIKRRVKASSVLEVVVAMVLIMVIFGIAMMIVANVTRVSVSIEKIQAKAILNDLLMEEEVSGDPDDRTLVIDSITVEQIIVPYHTAGLSEIRLTAYSVRQEKLAELNKVIIAKNE